jgi:hypothetical protein
MVDSREVTLDGRAYYFSAGSTTGYAANPREGSILNRAVLALERLARRVEEPAHEHPTDRHFIRDELREVLARTSAEEPCARVITE